MTRHDVSTQTKRVRGSDMKGAVTSMSLDTEINLQPTKTKGTNCQRCGERVHRETIAKRPAVIILATCPYCKYSARTQTTGYAFYGRGVLTRFQQSNPLEIRVADVLSALRTELIWWLTFGAKPKKAVSE